MLTSNDLNTSKTTLEIDAGNNKINYEFAIAVSWLYPFQIYLLLFFKTNEKCHSFDRTFHLSC